MIFDFGKLWQKSYVGMIIHSTTLESEEAVKAMYGGKKWEKVGGQFLIGDDYKKTTQGSSTVIGGKYLAGATGGSETVTLNIKQIPRHTHSIGVMTSQKEAPNMGLSEAGLKTGGGFANRLMVSGGNYNASITGSSQEHNNMPPYKVVYIWERTALRREKMGLKKEITLETGATASYHRIRSIEKGINKLTVTVDSYSKEEYRDLEKDIPEMISGIGEKRNRLAVLKEKEEKTEEEEAELQNIEDLLKRYESCVEKNGDLSLDRETIDIPYLKTGDISFQAVYDILKQDGKYKDAEDC